MRSTLKGGMLPLLTPQGDEEGFLPGEAVFREFLQYYVPTLARMIEVTRESPQTQRLPAVLVMEKLAARPEPVSWDSLRQQLWNEDLIPWRMRSRFQQAIKALQIAWPQLNARATTRGLEIEPPH